MMVLVFIKIKQKLIKILVLLSLLKDSNQKEYIKWRNIT